MGPRGSQKLGARRNRLTLRIPEQLRASLDYFAQRSNQTTAGLARRILGDWVRRARTIGEPPE